MPAKILPFVKRPEPSHQVAPDEPSETLTAVLGLSYPEVMVPETIKGEEDTEEVERP